MFYKNFNHNINYAEASADTDARVTTIACFFYSILVS